MDKELLNAHYLVGLFSEKIIRLIQVMDVSKYAVLLKAIDDRKSILFAQFSPFLTHKDKEDAWQEVLDETISKGYNFVPESTKLSGWKYIRDTVWSANLKTRTLQKRDQKLRWRHIDGRREPQFTPINLQVLAILGESADYLPPDPIKHSDLDCSPGDYSFYHHGTGSIVGLYPHHHQLYQQQQIELDQLKQEQNHQQLPQSLPFEKIEATSASLCSLSASSGAVSTDAVEIVSPVPAPVVARDSIDRLRASAATVAADRVAAAAATSSYRPPLDSPPLERCSEDRLKRRSLELEVEIKEKHLRLMQEEFDVQRLKKHQLMLKINKLNCSCNCDQTTNSYTAGF